MLDINSKAKLLNSTNIDSNVINYLQNRLSNLDIKVLGNTRGNIFDLMNKGVLEGWCWETTETAICFLDDNDYIKKMAIEYVKDHTNTTSYVTVETLKSENYIYNTIKKIN